MCENLHSGKEKSLAWTTAGTFLFLHLDLVVNNSNPKQCNAHMKISLTEMNSRTVFGLDLFDSI